MTTRRNLLIGGCLALTALAAGPALAHHGWRWTEDGNFELTGLIKSVRLGNPHGVLMPTAKSGRWRSASPGATTEPA